MSRPVPLPDDPPPVFARVWRGLLPVGVVVMAVALATGVFDTSAWSAWIFASGAVIAVVGVASLLFRLFLAGRHGVATLEQRVKDEFADRGEGRP